MPYQIGILSAMPEVIFAALAQVEHELMDKTLRLPSGRSVPIWGLVLMSENFIPTSQDGEVKGRFFVYNKQMHQADFENDQTQWEWRGIIHDQSRLPTGSASSLWTLQYETHDNGRFATQSQFRGMVSILSRNIIFSCISH